MTSLVLFDWEQRRNEMPKNPKIDWGTGKIAANLCRPKSPRPTGTFLQIGEPIAQNYRNTLITLSNVRLNDELVPAPLHNINMTEHEIPLKFPSNHPYASHISEKSIFPTAIPDANDRPSTYSDPYIVTHKTRGNPFRREVHYHGLQHDQQYRSKWLDKHYMQLPRSSSDASSLSKFYPWPRKMFATNSEPSGSNTSTTATMKNKQQELLETTYHRDYCDSEGLGSHVVYDSTPTLLPTEQLKPHFQKTFDPANPSESVLPVQDQQLPSTRVLQRPKTALYQSPMATIAIPTMSYNESLDHQMTYGKDYVNLPEHLFPDNKAPLYTVDTETPNNTQQSTREIRYLRAARPATSTGQLARDHHASIQQVHAENRLRQLALIRPRENIVLLNQKYQRIQHPRHARPILAPYRDDYVNTFYDQMGNYVEERAGLYHTDTYDPTILAETVPEFNPPKTYSSTQTENETLPENQPGNQALEIQQKAIGDYQNMRNQLLNKLRLPQDTGMVDARIQEGAQSVVQRQTAYGQSYNHRTFLQENTLSPNARVDPTILMSSNHNQDLERVRAMNSSPLKPQEPNPSEKSTNEVVLVSPNLRPASHIDLYSTKHINEQTNGYIRRSTARVYDSPFKGKYDQTAFMVTLQPGINQTQTGVNNMNYMSAPAIPRSVKTPIGLPVPETVARNLQPNTEGRTTYQRSFKDISYREIPSQEPNPMKLLKYRSASMKTLDSRTDRNSSLREIQDRWSKTQALRDYHQAYPEPVPDVGHSTIRAKKEILIADTIAKLNRRIVK